MILLVADAAEDQAPRRLLESLQAAGAEVLLVDSDALRTGQVDLSLTWQGNHPVGGGLTVAGRHIPWASLRSAWLWRPWFEQAGPDQPEGRLDPEARRFFRSQWHRLQAGLGLLLTRAGVFCVNPVPAGTACQEKVWQLELARRLGLTVPETLLTTDLQTAREFYEAHAGDIIYKPLAMPLIERPAGEGGRERFATVYTNRVRPQDLADTRCFLPTPCLFQARVPKQIEVRATVIGRHVFPAAIDTQASPRAGLDWRRYDDAATRYSRHRLPPAVTERLVRLVRELGLVYGAADLILTPAGEYVFLELNPAGQYYWIEQLTGLPLTANLARMLLAASPEYEAGVESDDAPVAHP